MEPETEINVPKALAALAHEVVKLDQRTVELAEANKAHTATIEAMVNAQERIMKQHSIAFRRIAELLVSLGVDIQGPEISELRRLFDLPSKGQN